MQEVLIRFPQKLLREFQSEVESLLEGHLSTTFGDCRLFNFVKAGRVGILISTLFRIHSIRIVEERVQRGKYHPARQGEGESKGNKEKERKARMTVREKRKMLKKFQKVKAMPHDSLSPISSSPRLAATSEPTSGSFYAVDESTTKPLEQPPEDSMIQQKSSEVCLHNRTTDESLHKKKPSVGGTWQKVKSTRGRNGGSSSDEFVMVRAALDIREGHERDAFTDDGSLFALKFSHQALIAGSHSYPALKPSAKTHSQILAEQKQRHTVRYWLGKEIFIMVPGKTKFLSCSPEGSIYIR